MSDVDFYWRCAICSCVYRASQAVVYVDPYPGCPACGEEEDVFRADDGQWPPEPKIPSWVWKADRPVARARHAR